MVTSGIEMTEALLYYLIVINVVTFLLYGIDKWKAKKGSWRISEATLLILAAIGGSIGASFISSATFRIIPTSNSQRIERERT